MSKQTQDLRQAKYLKRNRDFFDNYTPEYSPCHNKFLLDFVKSDSSCPDNLLDIGCGNGSVLDYFRMNTAITEFTGLDISPRYLEQAGLRGFKTYQASILDLDLHHKIKERFSYVLSSNLLHHLVGQTRNASKANTRQAIINALMLLCRGGRLLIHELVFSPPLAMGIVFWVKKLTTMFTSSRLSSFSSWHNIGAPVVSYLSKKELRKIIDAIPNGRIVMWREKPLEVTRLMRLGLIHTVGTISCVVEKTS